MKIQVLPTPIVVKAEDEAGARRLLNLVRAQTNVGVDTETNSLNAHQANLLVFSLAWAGRDTTSDVRAYVQFGGATKKLFKDWFREPKFRKSFHNAKYDLTVLERNGMPTNGLLYDTFIIDWLLDENREGRHGLKECALDHLGLVMEPFDSLLKRHKAENFMGVPEADQIEYSSKDAWVVIRLLNTPSLQQGKSLLQALKDTPAVIPGRPKRTLHDHLLEVEMPFVEALRTMERRGICIDRGYLLDLDPQLTTRMEKMKFQFAKLAKRAVNLDSNNELIELFFKEMKIDPIKMTKGGASGKKQPAIDKEVLAEYASIERTQGREGLWTILAEYRKVKKIHSTYVTGLLAASDNPDFRIHSNFRPDKLTGRLSSTKPNLQNIPNAKRDEYGLRSAFIPDPSPSPTGAPWTLLVLDLDQVEMRIAAVLSGDPVLISTIKSGVDVHSMTAASMYGIKYEDIMAAKEKKDKKGILTILENKLLVARESAKAVGFGILYGMGAWSLSKRLGCSFEEAKRRIDAYFKTYPDLAKWLDNTKASCRDTGFVTTFLGRRRRIEQIKAGVSQTKSGSLVFDVQDSVKERRKHGENMAVNSPVQGGAADIVKLMMLVGSEVVGLGDKRLQALHARLLLQIHDELVWEIPEDNVEKAIPIIRAMAEKPLPFPLSVPITASIGSGMSWSEAK